MMIANILFLIQLHQMVNPIVLKPPLQRILQIKEKYFNNLVILDNKDMFYGI